MSKIKEETLHNLFLIGLVIKGIDGILELIGGIALAFARTDAMASLVQRIFHHELLHDPTDIFANYFINASEHMSLSIMSFASIYLIAHGLIKLGLFSGLWYKKVWVYPLAGIVLSLLVAYQLIRFFGTHSVMLLSLTLVDIMIIILLRFEYKRLVSGGTK
ncbi:MAG: DUF2127 domain-containing protein [archaeon]